MTQSNENCGCSNSGELKRESNVANCDINVPAYPVYLSSAKPEESNNSEAAMLSSEARESALSEVSEVSAPKSFATNIIAGPASIVELARGLKNNVDLIYEFCANNVEFLPTFGLQKGGFGALVDGYGNSFDQSDLMIQLLRQSGYTADYVFGTLQLNSSQWSALFGTDTNIDSVAELLKHGGFQYAKVASLIEFSHVWVRVNIGGTNYYFDPTYKTYSTKTGIDLATAMGYNATSFMANATSGATIAANYVQNMNRANIRADLTTMSTNLANWIKANNKLLTIVVSGTVTTGDVVTLTMFNSGLSGGKKSISYTVPAGSTTSTIATALKNAINADASFAANNITATSTGSMIVVTPASSNVTSIRFDTNSTATERFTVTNPQADVTDILGGRTIVPVSGTPLRQTSLPYQKPGSTPTIWTSVPNSYKTTLRIQYDAPNIDVTLNSSDIYGKRLTLFFNASHQAQLRLDGVLLGTSSARAALSVWPIDFTVTHPYPENTYNKAFTQYVTTDKYYVVANAWGNAGDGMVDIHKAAMFANSLAGNSDTSEAVLGEALSAMWYTWNAEKSRACDLLNRMTGCVTVLHHQVGVIGYNRTSITDLGMIEWASSALDNNFDRVKWNDDALAMHGLTFEALLQEEALQVGGVSSNPIIDIAAAAGQKIYDGQTGNWSSVRASLAAAGYTTDTLDFMQNYYVNFGWRVVAPESPSITKGSWTGFGFNLRSPFQGVVGIISGGLKGGSADEDLCSSFAFAGACADGVTKKNKKNTLTLKGKVEWNGYEHHSPNESPNQNYLNNYDGPASNGGNGTTGGDPVDMRNGAFLHTSRDFRVGTGTFPYSLSFDRFYSSADRFFGGPLGLGWGHNWQMLARAGGYGMRGLGTTQPIDSVAAIVEMFISVDLYKDLSRPHDKFVTTVLMNQWLIDQLSSNVVDIKCGNAVTRFTRLPDGSFQPPTGERSTLSQNLDGTYTCKNAEQVAYNFNTAGDIASIVFPNGPTVSFTYTSGKLTGVSNGMGRSLTIAWTGEYISSVTDGTGRSVGYTVDANKNLTQYTNAEGKTTAYAYALQGQLAQIFYPENPSSAFVTNTFDSLGRVKEQKDALNRQTTLYLAGSRTELVDPVGNAEISYWNSTGVLVRFINGVGKTLTHQLDGMNRRVKTVLPEGNTVEYLLDAKSNILQIVRRAKPASTLIPITNSFTYHPTYNKPTAVVDGLLRATTLSYDSGTGNLLSIQRPTVGGLTPTIGFTWNARGQILTRTDETSIVTRFTYDTATERMTSKVVDDGVGRLNLTTQYGHNSRGDVTSVTDPRNKTTTFEFDKQRNVTKRTVSAPFGYVTNWVYNNDGRLSSIQRQTDDVSHPWQTVALDYTLTGEIQSITDPSGNVVQLVYDNADRLWKKVLPISASETRTWELSYDAANRVSTVKDPASVIQQTRLYTDNGFLASVKDGRNKLTQFTWDGFDRPDKTIYQGGAFEQNQSYDQNHNVLTYCNRSGNTIVSTFDELNRRITRSPQGQPTVSHVYDLAGRLTKASKPVVTNDPSSGDFLFFFDTAGRFWKEQYPDGKTVQHVLDANGNLSKTTWPDGWYVERVFDELNRLSDIKLNGATTAALHINWNALSQRASMVFENGVTTTYGHELDEDLSSLLHSFVGSSVAFDYAFNDSHQLISQKVSDGNFLWNPTTTSSTTYGTANDFNQYPTVGGLVQTYNGNGCLTSDGSRTLTYDTENHLTTVGSNVSNVFDPMHRVREHLVGTTKNRYIYAGWQRIADYVDATLQNRFVYAVGLDEPVIQVSSSNQKTYLHSDRQGSIVATSDSTGAVINKYAYGPMGEGTPLVGVTHGYTGQRYEAATGLYYYKLRHYDPKTGRFLQPDPIGIVDDLNLYTYVRNDGLNLVDPLGLKSEPSGGGYVPFNGGGGWPNGGGATASVMSGGVVIANNVGGPITLGGVVTGVKIIGAGGLIVAGVIGLVVAVTDDIPNRAIPEIGRGFSVLLNQAANQGQNIPDEGKALLDQGHIIPTGSRSSHGNEYTSTQGGHNNALDDFHNATGGDYELKTGRNGETVGVKTYPQGGSISVTVHSDGNTSIEITPNGGSPKNSGAIIRY